MRDSAGQTEEEYRTSPALLNNNDTFALYEKELQARNERVAELELRLEQAEERYRSELASAHAALHTAEAELTLLRPLHIQRQQQQRSSSSLSATRASSVDQEAVRSEADSNRALSDEGSGELASTATPAPPHAVASVDKEEKEVPEEEGIEAEEQEQEEKEKEKERNTEEEIKEEDEESEGEIDERGEEKVVLQESRSGVVDGVAAVEEQESEELDSAEVAKEEALSTLINEYGRTTAEVKLLAQELLYYKQLTADAQKAKAEETLAARQAATVAVQACMRRADCEQELADAMFQVQDLHRQVSGLRIEVDEQVRRNYALKSRLQLYAQKLSAMEVDYSLSMCQLEEHGLIGDSELDTI